MSCPSPGRSHIILPPLNGVSAFPGSWRSAQSPGAYLSEGESPKDSPGQSAGDIPTGQDRRAFVNSDWRSHDYRQLERSETGDSEAALSFSPYSHPVEGTATEPRRAFTDQWRMSELRRLETSDAPAPITQEDLQVEFVRLAELLRAEILEMASHVRKGIKEDILLLCEDWRQNPGRRKSYGTQLELPHQVMAGPASENGTSDHEKHVATDGTSQFNGLLDGIGNVTSEQRAPRIKRFSRGGSQESMIPPRTDRTNSKDRYQQYSCNAVADAVAVTSDDQNAKVFQPILSTTSAHISRRPSQLAAAPVAMPRSKSDESPRLSWIVNHPLFDYCVAALIMLNGVLVGIQTDYMARELEETTPTPFQVLEVIFCVIFTSEVALRLWAFRCGFFTRGGMGWNIFDLIIVSLQLVEIFLGAVSNGLGFSFNLLRILRLIRIIRLARALRLIGELRTIVSSIAGSLKPLFWTGMLLMMVIYVLSVYITQVVLNKRMTMESSGEATPEALTMYWGSVFPAIFSLFESIAGGVDWDTVVRPLIQHISPEMAVLFCLYIMFTNFAMLNVVTGVFIESVMKNAKDETEQRTRSQISSLFDTIDLEDGSDGQISWKAFENKLDTKEMRQFFKTIDVDISNARNLFDLLDVDEKGTLQFEEFMDGCLRIWSPSSGLDLRMIRRDVSKLNTLLKHVLASSAQS